MRFKSIATPEEYGAMVLNDDGTFQVVPSDELRDKMALLEEQAIQRSQTFGTGLGTVFLVLGAVLVGAGWLTGRMFGKLGHTLSKARPLNEIKLTRSDGGQVRLAFQGASRLQAIQMAWNADEVLQDEADAFFAKVAEMRNAPPATE